MNAALQDDGSHCAVPPVTIIGTARYVYSWYGGPKLGLASE